MDALGIQRIARPACKTRYHKLQVTGYARWLYVHKLCINVQIAPYVVYPSLQRQMTLLRP